jgi:hypothetical protein
MSQPEDSKPEYGQYKKPEYGAMSGQYGPNYNPYIYGAPEPEPDPTAQAAQGAQSGAGQQPGSQFGQQGVGQQGVGQQGVGQQGAPGYYPGAYTGNPANPGNPGMQGQTNQSQFQQSQQPNHQPHYFNGIDLNDPNQNPLYGHWDSYAIISFALALFFPVPVLSALMGAVAMWRTKTFHMKGFGLALAAVIINVVYTIAVIWMAMNGVDAASLLQQMLQQLNGGGSSSGDSISA